MLEPGRIDSYLETAVSALRAGSGYEPVLEALPVPIYVTDADGQVRFANRACEEFTGRKPLPGQDRWCVAWRLSTTDGEEMAHDQSAVAVALRGRRAIRNFVAIAQRPDGSSVAFRSHVTPLLGSDGELTGAANLMIDISDEQIGVLAVQAERCRRLSQATHDRTAAGVLNDMARGYDRTAAALRTCQ